MIMRQNLIYTLTVLLAFIFLSSFSTIHSHKNQDPKKIIKDTVKVEIDSLKLEPVGKLVLHKKNAHASYYHQKFHGRKTASGAKYDSEKLTAAHRKFPFGTKLKVTNETNGKSVIVTVNDRGPFVKGREIDLSRRAFREIAVSVKSGTMKVTIEKVE